MSSEGLSPDEIREPKPKRLAFVGICVLVAAGAVVVSGVRGRARIDQEVAHRTREQAVPTVEVIAPKRGAEAQALVLPGNIEALSNAPIYARASGYVASWHKDIGDKVKRGDVLARIDTPELDQQYAQVKADVANAVAAATLSAATAKRYRELADRNIASRQRDDEAQADAKAKQAMLEAARANLARLEALVAFKTITAPFDGIVTTRAIDVGALINGGGTTGTALYHVADIKRVRIYVRVPQAYVGDLARGTKASLRLPQYPGRDFAATMVGSSNAIAQESRTALVQLQADNAEGKLWPGTYTEVRFELPADQNALSVPTTALVFGEKGLRVATLGSDDRVLMKNVQIGRDIGNDVEVVAGLAPSDRLIDSPLETLNTGDKVRIVKDGSGARVVDAQPGPKTAK